MQSLIRCFNGKLVVLSNATLWDCFDCCSPTLLCFVNFSLAFMQIATVVIYYNHYY